MTTTTHPICRPRFATPTSPDRLTLGPAVAELSRYYLNRTLMPWQRHVVDLALEIDPETGRLAFREVILTVPRQSGKSTLLLPVTVHRSMSGFFGPRQHTVYSAQTYKDAREKWEEDFVADLEASKRLSGKFTVSRGSGREAVRFKDTRSRFGIVSNTEKAGHGSTLDLRLIDEAFALVDDRHEQSSNPAMITRPQPQRWIVSTAGDEKSSYLRGKVERGRELAAAGVTSGVAYVEYSAPEDADPGDPATWWGCMPALGYTVSETAVAAEFASMKLLEFRRAFLNQWVDKSVGDQVIPDSWWRQCADAGSAVGGAVVFAVDVAPNHAWASVGVAGWRPDGLPHGELVEHRPDADWVVARLVELRDRHDMVCDLVLDPAGPVSSLLPALRAADFDPVLMTVRDQVQACGGLFDKSMPPHRWRHLGQPDLNAALASAAKRDLGDAWALSRRASGGDISPLVAVAAALWGLETFGSNGYDVLDSVW